MKRAFFAVVEAFKQVAAGVVGVVLAGVVAQRVVEELGRRVVDGPARGLGVEQVAGRVEGEGFFALQGSGAEQTAERVVTVVDVATAVVVQVGQLPGVVIAVIAYQQARA